MVSLGFEQLWFLNLTNPTNRLHTHSHTILPPQAFSPADCEVRQSMWGAFSSQLVCLLMSPNHPFYHCHPFLLTSIPPPLPPSLPPPQTLNQSWGPCHPLRSHTTTTPVGVIITQPAYKNPAAQGGDSPCWAGTPVRGIFLFFTCDSELRACLFVCLSFSC